MRIIKSFAIAAGLAALAACGGADTAENTDANLAADNLTIDANSVTVVNEGMDMNATTDMNMMDMNATTTDANLTTNNTY